MDAWPEKWNWKRQCTANIRAVDPASGAWPVYLLDHNEAAGVVDPEDFGCMACTSLIFSERFEPLLRRRGEWDGPGFVGVFNTEALTRRGVVGWEGIVFHEYCHDVLSRPVAELFRAGELPDDVSSLIAAAADGSQPLSPVGPTLDNTLRDHNPDFIRLTLHVAHRAWKTLRWCGDALDIFNRQIAFLSSTCGYEEAIGDEPARLAELPLAVIPDVEPPAEFIDFAEWDREQARRRYAERFPELREEPCRS